MKHIKEPRQIGEVLRELFIIREDGSVDHDMVVAYAAECLSEQWKANISSSEREQGLSRQDDTFA